MGSRWPCALWFLLLHIRSRWLAQSPRGPNSNFYTSSCFKYNSNQHIFSRLEPACFAYCSHHWPTMLKTHLGAMKHPSHCCLWKFSDSETSHLATEPFLRARGYVSAFHCSPLSWESPCRLPLLGGAPVLWGLGGGGLLLWGTAP